MGRGSNGRCGEGVRPERNGRFEGGGVGPGEEGLERRRRGWGRGGTVCAGKGLTAGELGWGRMVGTGRGGGGGWRKRRAGGLQRGTRTGVGRRGVRGHDQDEHREARAKTFVRAPFPDDVPGVLLEALLQELMLLVPPPLLLVHSPVHTHPSPGVPWVQRPEECCSTGPRTWTLEVVPVGSLRTETRWRSGCPADAVVGRRSGLSRLGRRPWRR